jgi:mono/diheme cytochrome c family protein
MMSASSQRLLVAALAAGLAATAAAAAPKPDPALERGRHLAERDCAMCHAIDTASHSPNPGAPTFRTIRLRYNPIALERRLAPIPMYGHSSMPPRTLSAADVPDLVAYIQSLEP